MNDHNPRILDIACSTGKAMPEPKPTPEQEILARHTTFSVVNDVMFKMLDAAPRDPLDPLGYLLREIS